MTKQVQYATQSSVSDPGDFAEWLDSVPAEIAAIQRVSRQLVLHYRSPDLAEQAIAAPRMSEIDTRYADLMLERLRQLDDGPLAADRAPSQRLIGCCRDFTLLYVTMARHHGIPARARVGFASYFLPGWFVDHVVAEVWDQNAGRWRLVEAEIGDEHADPNDGVVLDPLDIPRDRFLVGPQAWLACRWGEADPERFVVAPNLEIPDTRSWPYLAHNLIHDLVALNKQEMVLWDIWGMMEQDTPPTAEQMTRLDALAERLAAPDLTTAAIRHLADRPEFQVPPTITSVNPLDGSLRQVTLRASAVGVPAE